MSCLENTNSFVICTPYQEEELRRHKLIERKIPNANRNLVLLMKEENQHDQQILRYVSLPPGRDKRVGERIL